MWSRILSSSYTSLYCLTIIYPRLGIFLHDTWSVLPNWEYIFLIMILLYTRTDCSKPNSLNRRQTPPKGKPYPVDSEVNISGSMIVKAKNVLKSIEKKDQTPLTSEKFPTFNGHRGPLYEIRFIPSDFSRKNASLYVDVAQSYLRKKSKKGHSIVEIPAMNVTVSVLHQISEGSGSFTSNRREIKSVSVPVEAKSFDSRNELQNKVVVASFPQLVSHAELQPEGEVVQGQALIIRVNMSVWSDLQVRLLSWLPGSAIITCTTLYCILKMHILFQGSFLSLWRHEHVIIIDVVLCSVIITAIVHGYV